MTFPYNLVLNTIAILAVASFSSGQDSEGQFQFRKVLGYLEAYDKVNMNSSQAGIISAVHVKQGSLVEKGDPVIEVGHGVLKAQLKGAKEVAVKNDVAVEIAYMNHLRAKSDHDKLRILRNASQPEIYRAHADEMRAEGELKLAKEEKKIHLTKVEEIQAQIDQHILRSPMDGIVVEVNRKVAESTSIPPKSGEQETAIIRIAQLDKLRLVINIPLDHAQKLDIGSALDVLILNTSSIDPNRQKSGSQVEGTIEFISPEADPSSETVRTEIVIDNSEGRYRSGTHAYTLLPNEGYTIPENSTSSSSPTPSIEDELKNLG
ncbi:MAG: efflux RND transporter periplasmic adaptor subunit, partial [Verrucomicrobiota bacterium]